MASKPTAIEGYIDRLPVDQKEAIKKLRQAITLDVSGRLSFVTLPREWIKIYETNLNRK